MKIGFSLLLVFTFLYANAQDVQNVKIENQLKEISKWSRYDAKNLTDDLIRPFADTSERALIIFEWVSRNIQYDWDLYYNPQLLGLTYNAVGNVANYILKKKKGVCAGYAELLRVMMNEAGIECVKINGCAKGVGYNVGDSLLKENHTWNAIKLKGKWKLVDVTWANQNALNNAEKIFFFCTPPEQFIVSHFPLSSEWQLLKDTVTKQHFEQLPLIYPPFFSYCSFQEYPLSWSPKIKKDSIEIKLPIPCKRTFWDFSFNGYGGPDEIHTISNNFYKADTVGQSIIYTFSIHGDGKKKILTCLLMAYKTPPDNPDSYSGEYAISFLIDSQKMQPLVTGIKK